MRQYVIEKALGLYAVSVFYRFRFDSNDIAFVVHLVHNFSFVFWKKQEEFKLISRLRIQKKAVAARLVDESFCGFSSILFLSFPFGGGCK